MAWTTVGNIKGPQGIQGGQGTQGVQGPAGEDGRSVTIKGSVASAANLPATAELGDGWITNDDGHLHVWGTGGFTDVGTVRGPQGVKGDTGLAATVAVGATQTGAPGSAAAVAQGGTPQARVFDFTIPQGLKGDPGTTGTAGAAATVSVASTSTGQEGTNAIVTQGGTAQARTLAFTIPRGNTGTPGTPGTNGTNGAAGARGSKWFTGSGVPASVPGSLPGDQYLDVATGDVFTLA